MPEELTKLLSTIAPWLTSLGIGTVIASLVAARVARQSAERTVKTEIHKVYIGAQQKVHELLITARLAAYGELSGQIAHLWKDAPAAGSEIPVLEALLKDLDAWDVDHGVLLGPDTTNDFHDFRWRIFDVLADLRAGKVTAENYKMVRGSVHKLGMQLELSLRSDIGVYGLGISEEDRVIAPKRRTSWDGGTSGD